MSDNSEILLETLKRGNIDLESLTPQEKEIMIRILEEGGDSTTLDKLYEMDYERRPPTIQEFCEDEYYLGSVCGGNEAEEIAGLFPKWRECLYRDFAPGSTVQQTIFSGSIGLGKSFVGSILVLYKVAHALCLREPLQYYGLNKATSLVFAFFSVTQKQVLGGTFADCTRIMAESPFFKERVQDVKDRKYSNRRIELTKNIVIEAGSKIHEALGRNSLVTLIDEINFRLEKDPAKSAYDLVEAIKRRAVSRFQKNAENPYMMIIISSARNETDFLTNYINEMRNNAKVRVYDFPWWDVAGAVKMKYCGERFRIDVGDNVSPPRILEDLDVCPPDRELLVPVEHKEDFQRDLSGYIRDLAGRSVGRISKFFHDIHPLVNSIDDNMENPMMGEEIPLSLGVDHDVKDFVKNAVLLMRRGDQMVPRTHPTSPRFIHLDMSMGGDAFGFCMLHPTHATEIGEFNPMTAIRENVVKPCFQIDLLLRFVRARGSKENLDFGKVRAFIWWLKTYCNFQIEMVSSDLRLLSADTLNTLKANGLNVKYQSVDKTKEPYEQMRQAISEGRLKIFDHEWFFTEAMYLENLPDKIDHPSKFPLIMVNNRMLDNQKGSKDCTDGVAGALFMAQQSATPVNLNTSRAAGNFFNEYAKTLPNAEDSWLISDVRHDAIRTLD